MKKECEEYLMWKSQHATGWKSYRTVIRKFDMYFQKNISEITLLDLGEYFKSLYKQYKPLGVRYHVCVLKDFYKYTGYLNPHHLKYQRVVFEEVKFLTDDEFQLIDNSLNEWNEWELRAKVLHRMLWDSGMRVSEIASIRLDDIDIESRSIKIVTGKSKKYGYVMWTLKTHALLVRYLATRINSDNDFLFPCSRTLERIIKEISKRVGLQGVHPHTYRHSKAHKIIRDGGHIDDVTFVLRHVSPELTRKMYLRMNKQESTKLLEKYTK